MDIELSESQERLRTRVRELLATEAPLGRSRRAASPEEGYSADLWRRLSREGLLKIPFGGWEGAEGAGLLESCLILEELARARVPTPFLTTVILCASAVARWGADQQRRELAPAIESGDLILSFADFESGMAWNAMPHRTNARASRAGYLLDGVKSFVPFARAAHKLLVSARIDAEPALFLVDAQMNGVSIEPLETIDWDAYCQVTFDRVELPSSARIDAGPLHETGRDARHNGEGQIALIRAWGAAARCAEMVGGSEQVLEMCITYSKKRQQFGRPIGSFQAIQHRCADMAVDALSSHLVTYEAIWRLDRRFYAGQEVSVAKAWAGEAYQRICSSGHQIHGALGYTAGHPMHRFYRHARSAELSFGDSEFHREILARQLGM